MCLDLASGGESGRRWKGFRTAANELETGMALTGKALITTLNKLIRWK